MQILRLARQTGIAPTEFQQSSGANQLSKTIENSPFFANRSIWKNTASFKKRLAYICLKTFWLVVHSPWTFPTKNRKNSPSEDVVKINTPWPWPWPWPWHVTCDLWPVTMAVIAVVRLSGSDSALQLIGRLATVAPQDKPPYFSFPWIFPSHRSYVLPKECHSVDSSTNGKVRIGHGGSRLSERIFRFPCCC